MKRIFLITMLLAFMATMLYAGDVYDKAVYVRETPTTVTYYGSCVFATADLENNHWTQFFQIDDLNANDAYIWAYMTDVAGTEDVNVMAYYSSNTDTSIATSLGSGTVIDQVTATTIRCDTLNRATGVQCAYYKAARFMRLNFDGQTSNVASTLTWWITFKKNNPAVVYGPEGKAAYLQILNHKP